MRFNPFRARHDQERSACLNPFRLFSAALNELRTIRQRQEAMMAAIDDLKKNDADLEAAVNDMLSDYRAQSAALADATGKLMAGLNGAPDVDIAAAASKAHDLAERLRDAMAAAHTSSVGTTTANASTSVVQGASSTGPDVVSASSPGVIKPPPSGDESSTAVPTSLGGGAMPASDATSGLTEAKDPGTPLPQAKPNVEPAVPGVSDIPSSIADNAPDSTKTAQSSASVNDTVAKAVPEAEQKHIDAAVDAHSDAVQAGSPPDVAKADAMAAAADAGASPEVATKIADSVASAA